MYAVRWITALAAACSADHNIIDVHFIDRPGQYCRDLTQRNVHRHLSRNLNPAVPLAACQFGVQYRYLPQPVGELRILGGSVRILNASIKPPENLFERVAVAFAVAARKIRISAHVRMQQQRILQQ
jgi:hypothetical protein